MRLLRRPAAWFGLLLLLAPSARGQALVRGPYLQQGTATSIIVRWRTDVQTTGEVRFGPAPGDLSTVVPSAAVGTEHGVLLSGLDPDTAYYYSIGTSTQVLAGADPEHVFVTAPPVGAPVEARIWVVGDSGTANASAYAVRDAYLGYPGAADTRLFLMLGDNAYISGSDLDYTTAVFETYPAVLRRAPVWPTLGNHDVLSPGAAPYFAAFDLPAAGEAGGVPSGTEAYYAFDYGDIHFVSLDSASAAPGAALLTWLASDLAATTQRWIIVYWHHPPYSKGTHDSDVEPRLAAMRAAVLPVLEDYGVDLVLCGHSHSYERSFLVDGHYGDSTTFGAAHLVDGGDGLPAGDGAYQKPLAPHAGAVYVVAGSSGSVGAGPLDHPAMYVGIAELGSLVLDVDGGRLDATFLCPDGSTPDRFTLLKGPDLDAPNVADVVATSGTTVRVTFDEEVEPVSAGAVGSYALTGGTEVLDATPLSGCEVLLTTTALHVDVPYVLSVSGVEDLLGHATVAEQAPFLWLDPQVIAFQDGAAPSGAYAGTRDARLVAATPDDAYGTSPLLRADGQGAAGGEVVSLVRWDTSAIAPGSIVLAAELTFEVVDPSPDEYELRGLRLPWVEDEVTWTERAAGVPWALPGASGSGDTAVHVLASLVAPASGSWTVSLDAQGLLLVQAWLDDPAENHGLRIGRSDATDGVELQAREAGATVARPRLRLTLAGSDLGHTFCTGVPNSSGLPASLVASGSALVAANDLTLTAFDLPPDQFGYLLASRTQGFVSMPGGASGDLCLAGDVARFAGQIQSSGPLGTFAVTPDLGAVPTSPPSAVQAGETWSFQAWYRDGLPTPTSNFTSAFAITFH